MEALLILAFVLFIVGVGATIAYDKHKENKKQREEQQATRLAARIKQSGAKSYPPPSAARQSPPKIRLPKPVIAGPVTKNQMPTKTEYYTVDELKRLFSNDSKNLQKDIDSVNDELDRITSVLEGIFDGND